MTFGVRPSCVAMRRCGSSLALPETQCLHQTEHNVREFVFVQLFNRGSRWRFSCPCTRASSLSCMTGSGEDDASCLFSSITGFASNLFNLFNVLLSPQRHHVLHVPRISSWQIHPERSILDVSTRCIQQVSMVLHRKPMLIVVKTPPSCLRRSWRTQLQPDLQHQ